MAETPTRPTPAPWKLGYYGPSDEWIRDAHGEAIMMIGANDTRNPQNAALIVAACNACQQINPQNPQAVAQSLSKAVTAMKYAIAELPDDESCDCCGDPLCPDYLACWKCAIRAALASMETQETP